MQNETIARSPSQKPCDFPQYLEHDVAGQWVGLIAVSSIKTGEVNILANCDGGGAVQLYWDNWILVVPAAGEIVLMDAIIVFLPFIGTAFALLTSIAVVRMPDVYTCMHGATKGALLGVN